MYGVEVPLAGALEASPLSPPPSPSFIQVVSCLAVWPSGWSGDNSTFKLTGIQTALGTELALTS